MFNIGKKKLRLWNCIELNCKTIFQRGFCFRVSLPDWRRNSLVPGINTVDVGHKLHKELPERFLHISCSFGYFSASDIFQLFSITCLNLENLRLCSWYMSLSWYRSPFLLLADKKCIIWNLLCSSEVCKLSCAFSWRSYCCAG